MSEYVLSQLKLATLCQQPESYGLVERGAVWIRAGRIVWAGARSDLPSEARKLHHEDMNGRLATPALIDCHTHLVFGGDRAREFELRLQGATYEEIARAGGGIRSTVTATRTASAEALFEQALPRLDAMLSEGVGTVEIKSGYGLERETELKMLRVARRLATARKIRIQKTFLGAHAIPPEFQDRADEYIDTVCEHMLPAAHAEGLVDAVDGFCENIAFTSAQIARVFDKAKQLGLPVKLHAEQLSNQGGAALAARYQALSADHLEFLDQHGIEAMARAGTVAVLLPGAFYTLRETQLPPIAALREAGVPIAIATDCNPGSSPLNSLLLAMNMACTLFRLTPLEALTGATRNAARALGLADEIGTIEAGKRADLAIWNVEQPAELAYWMSFNPLYRRIWGGAAQ